MLLSLPLAILACIAVPFLFVRALPPVENSSRAIKNRRNHLPDPDCIGAAGFEWVGPEIPDAGSVVINGRK